jgi:hypothetical protein
MLAFGGSIGTNGTTISAPVVVVKNWAELDTKGNNGEVTGKIVVFNSPWAGSYGGSVEYRVRFRVFDVTLCWLLITFEE